MDDNDQDQQARADERAEDQDAGPLPSEELVPDKDTNGATSLSEVETLQQELALLETQLENMRDRYIRAVADLDNARKRARQAIAEARSQGMAAVLLDLLVLADSFERALETSQPGPDAPDSVRAVYDGFLLIHRQLMALLERRGVTPIEALGQPFDPTRHEAVAQIPATADQQEGTVALEMQKGYLFGDQVLRPSKVAVAVSESSGEQRSRDG